jgi:hypothetical protein
VLLESSAPRLTRDVAAKLLELLERVKGIEPSYSAWKAAALPLSYTRDFNTLCRFFGLLLARFWH